MVKINYKRSESGSIILDRELTDKESESIISQNITANYIQYYFEGDVLPIVENKVTIEQLNAMQFDEMKVYDWYFVRKIRKGVEVPIDVLNTLNAIDEKYNALKLELI